LMSQPQPPRHQSQPCHSSFQVFEPTAYADLSIFAPLLQIPLSILRKSEVSAFAYSMKAKALLSSNVLSLLLALIVAP
ncbi:hypothetical protein, partial [Pseudophaeobacter sp.]|uniref:hypothetical protein n=1 Tax=Pseudophaeobacter sp. TaxID=1971739 RepID=UPI0032998620